MTALTEAWQGALAAEEQAVFGYGLLGPYLSTPAERSLAQTNMAAHQARSEAIAVAMAKAGKSPNPPPADYPDLYPVSVGAPALRLALRLEEQAATAWRYLYSVASDSGDATAPALRAMAQNELTASAVRAVQWRRRVRPAAATVPFPGI